MGPIAKKCRAGDSRYSERYLVAPDTLVVFGVYAAQLARRKDRLRDILCIIVAMVGEILKSQRLELREDAADSPWHQ